MKETDHMIASGLAFADKSMHDHFWPGCNAAVKVSKSSQVISNFSGDMKSFNKCELSIE